jgi:beta propeller repeat protein
MKKAIGQSVFLILFVGLVMSPAAGSSETPCINDQGDTIRITTHPADQIQPAISGDLVVWADNREEGIYKVYLYDLAHPDIEPEPITPEFRGRQLNPQISGRRIVWTWGRSVYVYDLDTGEEREVSSDFPFWQPTVGAHVDGDWVVWHRANGSNYDLKLFNLTTDEARLIASGNNLWGRISGNTVLWGRSTGSSESLGVFLHDLQDDDPSNERSLSDRGRRPDVSGDHAVWSFGSGRYTFIEYQNHVTGEHIPRLETELTLSSPRISGNRVVWRAEDPLDVSSQNVHVYDIAEDSLGRITCDAANRTYLDVDGNRVVWAEGPDGNRDIYMFEFAAGPALDDIVAQIDGYEEEGAIKAGVAAAMRALVNQAAASLERGNTIAATKALEAAVNFIQGQAQNQLDPEVASLLVEDLEEVIAGI